LLFSGGNVTIYEQGSLKVVSNSLMNITGGFVYVRDGGQIGKSLFLKGKQSGANAVIYSVLDDKSLCDNGKNIQMDAGRFYIPPESKLNINPDGVLDVNPDSRFDGEGDVLNAGVMNVRAEGGTITYDVSVENTADVQFLGVCIS